MLPTLDTEILQTFIAIADSGSFTRAGESVGRTQSAVSMQMKRLEEIIGRSLFRRAGRNVFLSADGEALLSYARRITSLNAEAIAAFRTPEMTGLVRIGIFDDLAERFLPHILARFAKTHPLVELEVYAEDSHPLCERLRKGELDLALVGNGHLFPGEGQIVLREELVWVTSSRHCTHEREPLPVALTERGCSWRISAVRALREAGRSFRVCYSGRNHAALVAPVKAGLAVSTLPLSSVRPGMRVLNEADGFMPLQMLEVTMIRNKTANHPAIDALAQHVIASLAARPPADQTPYGGLALPVGKRPHVTA
ncbi:MAG TPA: LysR family transcriptional regulator [Rhizobiales bacterium]|nr:LysR family transcriptional regulator [Hyphomicrobiales bacterium]